METDEQGTDAFLQFEPNFPADCGLREQEPPSRPSAPVSTVHSESTLWRVFQHAAFWSTCLHAPPSVLSVIENGYRLPFAC